MPDETTEATHSRRDVMKTGATLLATPTLLAAAGGIAATSRPAQAQSTQAAAAGAALADPRALYPKPPFPPQKQDRPGLLSKMDPRPDHGEKTYQGSGRLAGRKALITGGDSGMGRAAAIAYAREGADVAIGYLPAEESDAKEVIDLIRAAGRKAVALPGDISEESFCKQLVADAVNQLGGLDILVNNAGMQVHRDKIEDITTEQFDKTFKTNVYAMFWITKAALQHLPAGAAIVNTSSIQAFDPSASLVDYAQTKACVASFTKSMAKQLIERGIRVNAVAPGPIWTPLQPSSVQDGEKLKDFGADSVFGRAGQPAELAAIYVLLASAADSYATGEIYGATGGQRPI